MDSAKVNDALLAWPKRAAKLEQRYGGIDSVAFYVTNARLGVRSGAPYMRVKVTFSDGIVRRYYFLYMRWLDADNARRVRKQKNDAK
jgi:hypothetical protein